MTLEELAAATGLTANDLIGIWDAEASGSTEPTQKLTAQQLAAAVKGLANLIGASDLDSVPTQGSNNAVKSGGVYNAIAQSTAFANRVDCSVSMETFAETVPAGTFQYFRMRYAEPSSAWNYSPGFVFAPSSTEKIVVMFNREGDAIAMKAKYGNSWSNWKSVSLS